MVVAVAMKTSERFSSQLNMNINKNRGQLVPREQFSPHESGLQSVEYVLKLDASLIERISSSKKSI